MEKNTKIKHKELIDSKRIKYHYMDNIDTVKECAKRIGNQKPYAVCNK